MNGKLPKMREFINFPDSSGTRQPFPADEVDFDGNVLLGAHRLSRAEEAIPCG